MILTTILGSLFLTVLLVHQYSAGGGRNRDGGFSRRDPPKPRPPSKTLQVDMDMLPLDAVRDLYGSLEDTRHGSHLSKYISHRVELEHQEQVRRDGLIGQLDEIGFDPKRLDNDQLEDLVRNLRK